MLEKTVEKYLCDRVEATGGVTRKLTFLGRGGAPDRLIGWPHTARGRRSTADDLFPVGVHVLVELKRPKGPGAEAHQQREHKRLRDIGFDVRVIHTKEEVDAFVTEMTT
ncbi:MAG: VRR-NUC domain-containing protein [Casimicrobium sp.]